MEDKAIGILINYYKVDTMSSLVSHPYVRRKYFEEISKASDKERKTTVLDIKFFNTVNYGLPSYRELIQEYGIKKKLSELCNGCSVCKNNTISKMVEDYNNTYVNTEAHKILANKNEGNIFGKYIEGKKSMDYLKRKKHAWGFIAT